MKRLTQILCLLLIAALLSGSGWNSDPNAIAPESSGAAVGSDGCEVAVLTQAALEQIHAMGESPDDNYRTWYEIFVYSFCDSDGDGIGDLKGVTSKLDYLQELGVNGIWLMPIHPSVSYHKYDVSDYYAIDPQYGTMEDFEEFIAQCRERNISVILDLVLNHTGSEHPWFREAYDYYAQLGDQTPDLTECPSADYYFFTREPQATWFYPIEDSGWYYEGKFWSGMPDLNLWNSEVREETARIMAFWMDKGVSGFRLDAAKEYDSGHASRNREVLSFLTETLHAIDPDAYMVAEVWDSFTSIADYYQSGIPSIFNFPFGDGSGKIPAVLRGIGQPNVVSTYATALQKADTAYRKNNPDYIDAPFLSNHDTGRIYGFCSGNEDLVKLAGSMNLFMSGSAFVYYGEELGMPGSGNDPSKRAPMVWNEERNEGTTDLPPECVLPESYPFGSLEVQRGDDNSVYNYYRQAIAIRQALPVISHGIPTCEAALNTGCVSAVRKTWNDQECIILMNIDRESAQVSLADYADFTLAASLSVNGESVIQENTALTLPACGTAVLIRN